nr:DUF1629 domain-containing protein [Neobacillus sp. Marseille-Q6967]
MKIWQLLNQYEGFEILQCTTDQGQLLFREHFRGVPMESIWEPPTFSTYQKGKESDFPSGFVTVPVFSEKAVNALREWLDLKGELLPLENDRDQKYYAFNVLNVLDCIEEEKVEVKRFKNGRIMKYTKYAFRQDVVAGQGIFKMVNHETKKIISRDVFVTDEFREKVLDSGLNGFDFIEVWNSEEAIAMKGPNLFLVDTTFGTTYTFEEASELVRNQGKTVASDKWALRLDGNQEIQVGQLQEDGSYLWVNPVYYPPIFIEMKWKVV